ncbi:MAG: sulfotransferase [Hyphomicrobiaceae bacterium]|nr:sulfotransferase [Hyphomicrobiaceae bacterium]
MERQATIPDYFVCIGAQKAGTTWLARMLARHDDVFMTPVKEIHYFDHIAGLTDHLGPRKRRSRYRKYHQRLWTQWSKWREHRAQGDWYRNYMRATLDDDWYASLFAERGDRKIAGEITPEYALIGESGLRHLKRLAPDARIVFIMRNPVTRAWSHLLHLCRSRKLNADALSTSQMLAMADEERFKALSDYIAVLNALSAVFPAGQVHLEFYEDIHADRRAALARICQFLGVADDPDRFSGLNERHNPSQKARMPADLRKELRLRYRAMARDIEEHVGRVPQAWKREFNLRAT